MTKKTNKHHTLTPRTRPSDEDPATVSQPPDSLSPGTSTSRRAFLKTLGVGGLSLAFGTSKARAEDTGKPKEELATLLDLSLCVGCGACVDACTEVNGHKYPKPEKPFPKMYPSRVPVEDWSDKQDVTDRLTPYNWLYIDTFEVEYKGEVHTINMPRRCLHCQNPPCANMCPWGAASKQPNGIVRIYEDVCLGGSKCRKVCPWHIPQRQTGVGLYLDILPSLAGNGVMYKCDRCFDRIEQGQLPACIEVCPMQLQTIGPRSEILAKAEALAEEIDGFIYGDKENGGTNTFYVSPVPFELLAENHKPGKGRPHLKPVPDMFATESSLTSAVFLAPVAGIAAGVIKTLNDAKKNKKGGDNE